MPYYGWAQRQLVEESSEWLTIATHYHLNPEELNDVFKQAYVIDEHMGTYIAPIAEKKFGHMRTMELMICALSAMLIALRLHHSVYKEIQDKENQ